MFQLVEINERPLDFIQTHLLDFGPAGNISEQAAARERPQWGQRS